MGTELKPTLWRTARALANPDRLNLMRLVADAKGMKGVVDLANEADRERCPLSFRTVAADDYRAALLLFYEQNNISAFKRMFLGQVEFALREYF